MPEPLFWWADKDEDASRNYSAYAGGIFMEQIIVALITGGITLAGVLLSNQRTQAVADTKLEELTREVREHNNFARRMPVVEEQIKVINHRISDLEEAQK